MTQPAPELRFRVPIGVLEGFRSSDGRLINEGALVPRPLPLSVLAMRINPEMGGHGLAFLAGRVDTLTRIDASGLPDPMTGGTYGPGVWAWTAEGGFNDDDDGRWTADRVRDGSLRFISVDLAGVVSEIEVTAEDEDGWPTEIAEDFTAGEIAGFTVCPHPAFPGAYVEMVDAAVDEPGALPAPSREEAASSAIRVLSDRPGCEPCASDPASVVASAGGPLYPPAAWFGDPHLAGPTPLTIRDDGRVFGHAAQWDTCHIGYQDRCLAPPRSASDYAYFHLGAVRTAEGQDVAVGHLVAGIGHAPEHGPQASLAAATAFYDRDDAVFADVRAGEDAHGIWVAGALRPGVTEERLRSVRSALLSGDWRRVGIGREMVAAVAVAVPGFPIPRTRAATEDGVTTALVASGIVRPPPPGPTGDLLAPFAGIIARDALHRIAEGARR